MGDFHWNEKSDRVGFYYGSRREEEKFLSFVEWKKECYISPSYELSPKTKPFKFIEKVWKENRIPVGLVHPEGIPEEVKALTKEKIEKIMNDPVYMCCQPYCVAGILLGVKI